MGLPSEPRWTTRGRGGVIAGLLGLLLLLGILAAPARADVTINVNTTTDETTLGNGTCSLREGVLYADGTAEADCAPGTASGTTTINVPTGHYVLSGGTLSITGITVINGAGAPGTIIDANGASEVVSVTASAQATLGGLTITGGNSGLPPCIGFFCLFTSRAGNPGGGIDNAGQLTLIGSRVSDNVASAGSAGLTVCFTGSACPGRSPAPGGAGGGIYNSGTLTITNSTISGNKTNGADATDASTGTGTAGAAGGNGGASGAGGGIDNNAGTLTITNSTISGNSTGPGGNAGSGSAATASPDAGGNAGTAASAGPGGAIENVATLTIRNSTISGNSTGAGGNGGNGGAGMGATGGNASDGGAGGAGGGIDSSTVVNVLNSTMTGNATGRGGTAGTPGDGTPAGTPAAAGSPGTGGALNQSNAGATLSQDTIASNTAAGIGGGLNQSTAGTIAFGNSIIASNRGGSVASNCGGTMIASQGNNVVFGDNTCGVAAGPDPQLVPLADNGGPTETMALAPGSSAANLVPVNACPLNADQRGVARPQGPACDAGAYELAPPSISGAAGTGSTTTSAAVTAGVNPNLKDTHVLVHFGPTTAYGSTTPSQDLGAGRTASSFSAVLSNLTPNTTVHAQIVASNADGTTNSPDISFTTSAAVSASVVSASTTGRQLSLTIQCSHGNPADSCAGPITLTSHKTTQGGKTVAVAASGGKTKPKHKKKRKPKPKKTSVVTVASGTYSVATGRQVTLAIALNPAGRKLLDQVYRVPATVTIGGTTPITRTVTFSFGRINSPVSFAWTFNARFSISQQLTISGLPSKSKVALFCHGHGCPFAKKRFSLRGRKLKLASSLKHRHLAPHTTVELEITASNRVGKVLIFTTRSSKSPSLAERCLPPGFKRPAVCARAG